MVLHMGVRPPHSLAPPEQRPLGWDGTRYYGCTTGLAPVSGAGLALVPCTMDLDGLLDAHAMIQVRVDAPDQQCLSLSY